MSEAIEEDSISRRTRIKQSAELLFSVKAYEGVSIRDIANDAAVNSALIRYYFGTKDELYRSLFVERYQIISRERLDALAAIPEGETPSRRLRAIVHAWVDPVAKLACREDDANFLMLLARDQLRRDDELHSDVRHEIDRMAITCIDALSELAPDVSRAHVTMAYTWCVSLAVNATANRRRTARLAGVEEFHDERRFVDSMVDFLTPGMAVMLHMDIAVEAGIRST